jgi:hypothetical protein
LIALTFADKAELRKSGRNFTCSKCDDSVKKLRRCQEDRFDFTEKDNASIWPMQVEKGGPQFGFCPGKATWDSQVAELYKILEISYHTKHLPFSGPLLDQPAWFVDCLHMFMTMYDDLRFASRQKAMWGGGGKSKAKGGENQGRGVNRMKKARKR